MALPFVRMPSQNEIRVLDLHPGNWYDRIACEIRIIALESNETYEALSYEWGENSSNHTIKNSGADRNITPNLYAALRRLRYPNTKRTLWIDQLCINQWDDDEKAEQIALMSLIYQKCDQCVIWLGEIEENSTFSTTDAQSAFDYINLSAAPGARLNTDIPVLFADSVTGRRAREAFKAIARRRSTWWSRIWTVQEAILPKRASVLWGPLSIPWNALEDSAYNMTSHGMLPEDLLQAMAPRMEIFSDFMYCVRGLAISKNGENPLNLIRRWRYRKATNPRDMVYGLMGLLPSNTFPSVPVYSDKIPPSELFSRVTFDLIRLEGNLRPLVGRRGEPNVTPNLPTWVLDMVQHEYRKERCWGWWFHSHRYQEFAADRNSRLICNSLRGHTVLSLRGICKDRVFKTGDVLGEDTWDSISPRELIATIKRWEHLYLTTRSIQGNSSDVLGGTLHDAFWKTILGDLIHREFPIRRTNVFDGLAFLSFISSGVPNETYSALREHMVNQVFFITEGGLIGIGPPTALEGDEVWILFGSRVPFVLRQRAEEEIQQRGDFHERYLIGDAYVHGIMDGEVVGDSTSIVHNVLIF